jgi:hypothetical protein
MLESNLGQHLLGEYFGRNSNVAPEFKHLLRPAKTYQGVLAAIAQLLSSFTSDECRNNIVNSGYNRT